MADAPIRQEQHEESPEVVSGQVSHNIEAVLDLYQREDEQVGGTQRLVETISRAVGRPRFLGCIIAFVVMWIGFNLAAPRLGFVQWDAPPFFWLGGIVSLGALLTSTAVLIKQNRLAHFDEQRAHLELQVSLLTEQKTTKLIQLIEELRRDLPMVKDRLDAEAEALKLPTDPEQVLATMDEMREAGAQARIDALV